MKHALVISVLILFAPIARAESVGYVDINRAAQESADGKKAAEIANAAHATAWKAKVDAAIDAVNKAKPAEHDAAFTRAQDTATYSNQDLTYRLAQAGEPIFARAKRIIPKIAAARHLSRVEPIGVWVAPSMDITAEVTRRLDAGEGKTDEEKMADVQKQNAELTAQLAEEKAKHATPTAPPIVPPAAPAKK